MGPARNSLCFLAHDNLPAWQHPSSMECAMKYRDVVLEPMSEQVRLARAPQNDVAVAAARLTMLWLLLWLLLLLFWVLIAN